MNGPFTRETITTIQTTGKHVYRTPSIRTGLAARQIDLEDFQQEVFRHILAREHNHPGFVAALCATPGLLYDFAKKRALDILRARRTADAAFHEAGPDEYADGTLSHGSLITPHLPGPEEALLRREETGSVRNLLETLPAHERATLALAVFERLKPEAIARLTGCTIREVYARKSSALRRLGKMVSRRMA
ncbi:MAG TPA: sigma-70 family RNA polymerase sigma factor [Spirochaetota bacterium]|nr:sigma-70 family RNA polymerase sigma factor [Spirochaetota bacterium]